MSLDVYLEGEEFTEQCRCGECGHEHTRTRRERYYQANITHNLNRMAVAAGIYQHLWHPDEIGLTKARELIEPLRRGLAAMKARPEHYKQFNAPNGWGLYEHFIPWIEKYLAACEEHPDASVRTWT